MVQQQLAGGKILKTGELGVSVAKGVVTLRGTVPHVWARDRAVKLAMEVAGVQAVDSELDIAFEESDKKLGENVAKKIRGYVFFTIYDDVNIGVEEGIVNLTGRVTWPFKATEIAERVSRVLGVQELRSEIQVLPVNSHDSRLRRVLAFRIYRDPLFVGLGNESIRRSTSWWKEAGSRSLAPSGPRWKSVKQKSSPALPLEFSQLRIA